MFFRNFNLLFQDVILVGAGGTGSRVVGPLIQTIKQARCSINPMLTIVDGDIFEDNNLTRQNCIPRDMGRNKAIVMAERYGTALDFPVVAHPYMVDGYVDLTSAVNNSATEQGHRRLLGTRKLVIMCVDNVSARLIILNKCNPGDIIIDCGNEDTFGQVSIFDNISVPHLNNMSSETLDVKPFSGEFELPFIPAPIDQYLEALVRPSASTGSCANLDQSLAINNLMAAGVINKVQNLAYNNPFVTRTDYYDLLKGNNSERMTNIWLNQIFNSRSEHKNQSVTLMSKANLGNLNLPKDHDDLLTHINTAIEDSVDFIDPALLALIK